MPEIGGAVAEVEPVAIETSTETVETPIESGAEGEISSGSSNEVDSSTEKHDLTQKNAKSTKLNLTEVVKKSAEALKAINPALPDAMRKAAFELGGLYREFPGGLKEAVQAKSVLSEFGGAEGIKELNQAVSDYSALETMFEKGDAGFWKIADEMPQAFSQIMPAGLEKWKASDPEMYNHVQARVLTQTLDGIGIRQALSSAYNAIDATTGAAVRTQLEKIWEALDGFKNAGEKAPERKIDPANEALTKREQALAERETKALLAPIATEGRQQIASITEREMAAGYQWNATDPDVKQAVLDEVRKRVVEASGKDKAFTDEFERLKARGDSAGLSRHVKNFQDRVTPQIIQKAARLYAVKPKNAGPALVKKAAVANGSSPASVSNNWERIASQPKFKDLDTAAMGRNYEDMIMSGKAILRGGKKVQWA